MRARITVSSSDGHFTLKMTRAQAALSRECLGLVSPRLGDRYTQFEVGGSQETISMLMEKLTPCANADARTELRFTSEQLHVIYSSLTSAVNDFIWDEDFHIRTGWYRENATAFARALSRAVRESISAETGE